MTKKKPAPVEESETAITIPPNRGILSTLFIPERFPSSKQLYVMARTQLEKWREESEDIDIYITLKMWAKIIEAMIKKLKDPAFISYMRRSGGDTLTENFDGVKIEVRRQASQMGDAAVWQFSEALSRRIEKATKEKEKLKTEEEAIKLSMAEEKQQGIAKLLNPTTKQAGDQGIVVSFIGED